VLLAFSRSTNMPHPSTGGQASLLQHSNSKSRFPHLRERLHYANATVQVHGYDVGGLALLYGPHKLVEYDASGRLNMQAADRLGNDAIPATMHLQKREKIVCYTTGQYYLQPRSPDSAANKSRRRSPRPSHCSLAAFICWYRFRRPSPNAITSVNAPVAARVSTIE